MADEPRHPAVYSEGIVRKFRELLDTYLPPSLELRKVMDPQAGKGNIHQLYPYFLTFGCEIEPEWARCHNRTMLGDATNMYWWVNEAFDAICTSPCYGNRMADSHTVSPCLACLGDGWIVVNQTMGNPYGEQELCNLCGGTGKADNSKRFTYTHALGRKLHANNGGQLQWGRAYRSLYMKIWDECNRVLKPGGLFILNCSDHIRKGELQEVTNWHVGFLESQGFVQLDRVPIATRRMKMGANANLRVDCEEIVTLRKPF